MSAHSVLPGIRLIEERIERQNASIERAGQDMPAAEHRLKLLQHALEEMRLQLRQLSPTATGARRPK